MKLVPTPQNSNLSKSSMPISNCSRVQSSFCRRWQQRRWQWRKKRLADDFVCKLTVRSSCSRCSGGMGQSASSHIGRAKLCPYRWMSSQSNSVAVTSGDSGLPAEDRFGHGYSLQPQSSRRDIFLVWWVLELSSVEGKAAGVLVSSLTQIVRENAVFTAGQVPRVTLCLHCLLLPPRIRNRCKRGRCIRVFILILNCLW